MHEFDVIAQYFSGIMNPQDDAVLCGPGDDAAVIAIDDEHALLVATDTFIQGVHFPEDTPAFAVGYKSLAVNLSDMAAMAAEPRWCTLAITLPETCRCDAWLRDFRRGFHALASQHGVSLIGGDTCAGAGLAVTVQILGTAPPEQIIYRAGARAGDTLYVTGELGTAAYALSQLQAGREIDTALRDSLYQPEPQVALGLSLRHKATAMIDISDGLLADVQHILKASEVGAVIQLADIPLHPALKQAMPAQELWQHVLNGGDDYQLCFTSALSASMLSARLDAPVFDIGWVVPGDEVRLIQQDGTDMQAEVAGFQHF